jgi:hypothetical protein
MSVNSLSHTVKLFCTIYALTSGRHRFDYSLLAEIIAGVLVSSMIAFGIGRAAARHLR